MLFAANFVIFSGRPLVRNLAAVIVALAAITLAGLKETFIPLAAGGPALIFVLAVIERRLSPVVIGVLACAIWPASRRRLRGFERTHAAGTDYCGKSADPAATLLYAVLGRARRASADLLALGSSAAVLSNAESRARDAAGAVAFGLARGGIESMSSGSRCMRARCGTLSHDIPAQFAL